MRHLRRTVQIVCLLVFLGLLFTATFPFPSFPVSHQLFLRASPVVYLSRMIASRHVFFPALPLIVMLSAVLVGRVFCGWVCPLGTTLDIVDFLFQRKKRNELPIRKGLFQIKYVLLVALLVTAVFAVPIIGVFDPICIATRTYGMIFFAPYDYFMEHVVVPYGRGFMPSSLYDWLRDVHVAPNRAAQPVYNLAALTLVVFLVICGLNFIARRFWCRALCPLGAVLGLLSRWRLLKIVIGDSCVQCRKCERFCKMGAIIEGDGAESGAGRHTLSQECIHCFSCASLCPSNAIRVQFAFGKTTPYSEVLGGRRNLLKAALAGLAVVPLLRFDARRREGKTRLIRPPGALPEEEFLAECVRCGECMKVCPNNAIQPASTEAGVLGVYTPVIVPRIGYCAYDCAGDAGEANNLCGRVCPTNAIRPLDFFDKIKVKMGTAYINKNKCIPWVHLENCSVCQEHCPVVGKAIHQDRRTVTTQDGETREVAFPYVVPERCIGCGYCEYVCPLEGEPGIYVERPQTKLKLQFLTGGQRRRRRHGRSESGKEK